MLSCSKSWLKLHWIWTESQINKHGSELEIEFNLDYNSNSFKNKSDYKWPVWQFAHAGAGIQNVNVPLYYCLLHLLSYWSLTFFGQILFWDKTPHLHWFSWVLTWPVLVPSFTPLLWRCASTVSIITKKMWHKVSQKETFSKVGSLSFKTKYRKL